MVVTLPVLQAGSSIVKDKTCRAALHCVPKFRPLKCEGLFTKQLTANCVNQTNWKINLVIPTLYLVKSKVLSILSVNGMNKGAPLLQANFDRRWLPLSRFETFFFLGLSRVKRVLVRKKWQVWKVAIGPTDNGK